MSYKILCHWSWNKSFFTEWKHYCLWFIIAAYSISTWICIDVKDISDYQLFVYLMSLSCYCSKAPNKSCIFLLYDNLYHWIGVYMNLQYVITSIYIFTSTAFFLFNFLRKSNCVHTALNNMAKPNHNLTSFN